MTKHLRLTIILTVENTTTLLERDATMITIENAKVETLDMNQARPVGKTVLAVTIGDHTFQMLVDEIELIAALSSDIVKIEEGRE